MAEIRFAAIIVFDSSQIRCKYDFGQSENNDDDLRFHEHFSD